MYKILGWIAVVGMFSLTACNQAANSAASDKAKISKMVKVKVDSLTKELAADCDRRIASAVKAKANAASAAASLRSTTNNTNSTGSAGTSSSGNSSTLPTTVKPATKTGKLGGKLGKTGKVITGTGEKIKQTVNRNFDPAKRKKGKLGGKK